MATIKAESQRIEISAVYSTPSRSSSGRKREEKRMDTRERGGREGGRKGWMGCNGAKLTGHTKKSNLHKPKVE
jgi:hypothetical protein